MIRCGGMFRTALFKNVVDFWARHRPCRCLVCGRPARAADLEDGCCLECKPQLRPQQSGFCPDCGLMYALEAPVSRCLECRLRKRPWDGFGFFGPYEGLLREILLKFKFQEGLGYSRVLQDLMLLAYREHLHPYVPDAILPVPLHPARLQYRGYNQSLELGRKLARDLQVRIRPQGLIRLHNTPPQAGLNRKERLENLKGAFQANRGAVSGKRLLLIDDIYTTGTTLTACAKALRKAGIRELKVLVLARARL